MSDRNYSKRPKTKPCVTKVNGFWSSILVKRFPSQKFMRQLMMIADSCLRTPTSVLSAPRTVVGVHSRSCQ